MRRYSLGFLPLLTIALILSACMGGGGRSQDSFLDDDGGFDYPDQDDDIGFTLPPSGREITCQWITQESFPPVVRGTCPIPSCSGKLYAEFPDGEPEFVSNFQVRLTGRTVSSSAYRIDTLQERIEFSSAFCSYSGNNIEISFTYNEGGGSTQPPGPPPQTNAAGMTLATVIWPGIGGCGYLLRFSNGQTAEPTNLAQQYRVHGKQVYVSVLPSQTFQASTCMAGPIVQIASIQEVGWCGTPPYGTYPGIPAPSGPGYF